MPLVRHRKVVMLGYPTVGKSSLALQFIHGEFPKVYEPTIEHTWSKTFMVGNDEFELDVVDTAGHDEYSLIPHSSIFGIHGYIVVYSVTCARRADSWGAAFMEVSAKDPENSKKIFVKIIEEIDRVERSFSDEKKCKLM
ncbi:GTPase RhebL1 [Pyxicephalus adspersus]|uniref:GTPase RhebL1 n=1 Tax=Pyxicephalus adspersus TaxID=30357 RepID=UPI003B5B8018